MIKNIIALPDEKIRNKSQNVNSFDENLRGLIKDLIETSEIQTDPPALGMAAPQLDVFKRTFVAKIRNKFRPFINPKITKVSDKETALMEGCFSVKGLYGQVMRPSEIEVEYRDSFGKKVTAKLKGLPAKIFQHELDHLNGTLFIDHVNAQNGKMFRSKKNKKGEEEFVELEQ